MHGEDVLKDRRDCPLDHVILVLSDLALELVQLVNSYFLTELFVLGHFFEAMQKFHQIFFVEITWRAQLFQLYQHLVPIIAKLDLFCVNDVVQD